MITPSTELFTKAQMAYWFDTHPQAQAELLKLVDQEKQQAKMKHAKLTLKRRYFAVTKNELKYQLAVQAKNHGLVLTWPDKYRFAFEDMRTEEKKTFLFTNGKDYVIDPKDRNDLSRFIAKSWHNLDADFIKAHPADFFVFFISRQLDSHVEAITFTYDEIISMLKVKHNFYFGITKTGELIENRSQPEKTYDPKHIGLGMIFDSLNK